MRFVMNAGSLAGLFLPLPYSFLISFASPVGMAEDGFAFSHISGLSTSSLLSSLQMKGSKPLSGSPEKVFLRGFNHIVKRTFTHVAVSRVVTAARVLLFPSL